MSDPIQPDSGDDAVLAALRQEVAEANGRAFALARAMADGEIGEQEAAAEALSIDDVLDELLPRINATEPDELAALEVEWNDARLDTTWVLTGGRVPSSLRFAGVLSSR